MTHATVHLLANVGTIIACSCLGVFVSAKLWRDVRADWRRKHAK